MLREPPRELPFLVLAADVLVAALGFGVLVSLPGMQTAAEPGPATLRLLGLGLVLELRSRLKATRDGDRQDTTKAHFQKRRVK